MNKIRIVQFTLLIAVLLSGCATAPSPADLKAANFSDWRRGAEARESRGELTRVEKLKEMYSVLAKDPVSSSDVAGMRWASADIATLEAYQAGKIDRTEADSRLRQSEISWQTERAADYAATRPTNTRCVTWQGFTKCATQ